MVARSVAQTRLLDIHRPRATESFRARACETLAIVTRSHESACPSPTSLPPVAPPCSRS